uniref:Peptidase S26 domain-containing protein n=1 Tax=Acrobeloides nanus TaxID=290746 RepID=A0A914DIQ6_9BILA
MEPTIQHGDIIIGEKMSVSHTNLHRGDIVCAYSPSQYPDLLCKRLMLKEYDKLPEDLCTSDRSSIPAGHCFLLGDNKEQSIDSRTFGAVPCGLIQVRLIFRIWPLNRFGSISTHGFWEHETTDTA